MTVDKLRHGFIDKKPILTKKVMLQQMNEIDPTFTEEQLKSKLQHIKSVKGKQYIVSTLILLQNMTSSEKGLSQIKCSFEDTLQVIHEKIRVTEVAQKTMAFDLEELEPEELEQFKTHKKVIVF